MSSLPVKAEKRGMPPRWYRHEHRPHEVEASHREASRLVSLFGNPVMLPVTRFAYDRFADLLFAWNRRKGRW